MGHLISEPKFKIPTPPPTLIISDKSLITLTCDTLRPEAGLVTLFGMGRGIITFLKLLAVFSGKYTTRVYTF